MMRRWILAGLALLTSAGAAQAEGGTLVIVGGGLDPANGDIYGALLDARPQIASTIAIIPAASGEAAASARSATRALELHGANPADIVVVRLALVDDPSSTDIDEACWTGNAHDPAEIAVVERAGAIWFLGGDQARIIATLKAKDGGDTPMLAAIRRRLAEGAVVGGTSAGAAIMSEGMISQGDSMGALLGGEFGEPLELTRGLGFLPGALVDQHFGERARLGRLAVALTDPAQPQRIGLGIDEDTALIVSLGNGRATVAGSGYVTLLDARAARRTRGRRIGIEGLALVQDSAAHYRLPVGVEAEELLQLDSGLAHGTVGAVALDRQGRLAAATSTGGLFGKRAGRVGDTPLTGIGNWADGDIAVSCTGIGEAFIYAGGARDIVARVAYGGASLDDACEAMLATVARLHGDGGVIAIDCSGAVTLKFNSPGMKRAVAGANYQPFVAII